MEEERERERNKPAGFKLAKSVLLVFLAAANSGGLAQLFSVSNQHSGSLRPSSTAAPGSTGSGTHPALGYGFVLRAFCDVYSPLCLWAQGPPRCELSPVLQMWVGCPPHSWGSDGQPGGEETGAVAAGHFPKLYFNVIFT